VQYARQRLPGTADGPLSLDGRRAGGPPGHRLPGCGTRPEPVATTREVVARDPPLHRAVLPGAGGDRGGDHSVVRDPLHGAVSARHVRVRRRRIPLGPSGAGLCIPAGNRPLPAVQPATIEVDGPNNSLVGVGRFELPAPRPQTACSARLSYTPIPLSLPHSWPTVGLPERILAPRH